MRSILNSFKAAALLGLGLLVGADNAHAGYFCTSTGFIGVEVCYYISCTYTNTSYRVAGYYYVVEEETHSDSCMLAD